MRRYLRPSAVNGPVSAWGLYKSMTSKRILTICAALTAASAAGAAGTSLAQAQQGYPVPPGAIYQAAPPPYVPGGYPADYRRAPGASNFDALEDDDAPNPQSSTALPPPGPVLSPDDPRYGRPYGAPPVYSNRSGAPTGPILSPDDPRYGRPDGPPPVIYSDRPAGPPQQTYSDRGNAAPNQDDRALRPPE